MRITNFIYDYDHAIRYIPGCIARLDDNLIYVDQVDLVDSGIKIRYYPLPIIRGTNRKSFYLEQEQIEWNPCKLGYVNFPDSCSFLYRTTRRVYKLGLHRHNAIFDATIGEMEHFYPGFNDSLHYPEYINSLNGVYPKLKELPHRCISVSNNFIVNYMGRLYYSYNRNIPIAEWDTSGKFFRLEEKYFYLLQLIEKDEIECRL